MGTSPLPQVLSPTAPVETPRRRGTPPRAAPALISAPRKATTAERRRSMSWTTPSQYDADEDEDDEDASVRRCLHKLAVTASAPTVKKQLRFPLAMSPPVRGEGDALAEEQDAEQGPRVTTAQDAGRWNARPLMRLREDDDMGRGTANQALFASMSDDEEASDSDAEAPMDKRRRTEGQMSW
jgi:hypothetical protein